MKIFAEKEAEKFLKKEGFEIIETIFINKKNKIKWAVGKIGFPLVMKVSGRKILHKNEVGGVKIGIKDYNSSLEAFNLLMKIKNSEGVLIQKKIHGKEFLLGIKKTPEFKQVIAFGIGGTDVEKIGKVSFRACPLNEKEAGNMVMEIIKDRKKLDAIKKNIMKLCNLAEKYPSIRELDINPLIVEKNKAIVVDARIIFD